MTNEIKAAREALDDFNMRKKSGFDLTGMGQWVWMHEKTILKALSAYERLQGVDLEKLNAALKSPYAPIGKLRPILVAAQIVADINKLTNEGN